MSTTDPMPQDDREPPVAEAAPEAAVTRDGQAPSRPLFDWQVLLLRYLPEPRGSTHAIKRLAPR